MSHRSSNDSSVREYKFNNKNLFLGHNRLSIQDLATHANQRAMTESGVWVV